MPYDCSGALKGFRGLGFRGLGFRGLGELSFYARSQAVSASPREETNSMPPTQPSIFHLLRENAVPAMGWVPQRSW